MTRTALAPYDIADLVQLNSRHDFEMYQERCDAAGLTRCNGLLGGLAVDPGERKLARRVAPERECFLFVGQPSVPGPRDERAYLLRFDPGRRSPASVVLEKGGIVCGGFDAKDDAELVVHLDRGGPHVVANPGAFDSSTEVVTQLMLVVGVELAAEKGRHLLCAPVRQVGAVDALAVLAELPALRASISSARMRAFASALNRHFRNSIRPRSWYR